jgi:hypothetical protein
MGVMSLIARLGVTVIGQGNKSLPLKAYSVCLYVSSDNLQQSETGVVIAETGVDSDRQGSTRMYLVYWPSPWQPHPI